MIPLPESEGDWSSTFDRNILGRISRRRLEQRVTRLVGAVVAAELIT